MTLRYPELYVLLSWTTYQRTPRLDPSIVPLLNHSLASACRAAGASPIAMGVTEEEVRCLMQVPPSLALTELAARMKGLSAHLVNNGHNGGRVFRWESDFHAQSVGKAELARTIEELRAMGPKQSIGEETFKDTDGAALRALARYLAESREEQGQADTSATTTAAPATESSPAATSMRLESSVEIDIDELFDASHPTDPLAQKGDVPSGQPAYIST
ncbi:MAG: transposase [Polyangiaceae bacterium]